MASIIFHHVDFAYPAASHDVFQGLSLLIDTSWRTGVVGRNGQGKTTLLKLVAGELEPAAGRIELPLQPRLFPGTQPRLDHHTLDVVRDQVAPFRRWERQMEQLLSDGSAEALTRYAEVHDRYLDLGGYEIDARIAREFDAMGLPAELLQRRFGELSGGEQTRALIVSLFLHDGTFPLIDEPTNHLDGQGRALLAAYLTARRGFMLVSHDRRFLDSAVDHILSINRADIRMNNGNFSQWRARMDEEIEAERRQRQRIERDVARLQVAARNTRQHAQSREADKYGTGAFDKGFIGHRAAKQMKRARNVERRIEAELAVKQGLLKNAEKQRRLKVETAARQEERLLVVQNLRLCRGGRTLFTDLSFAVAPGDRVALVGPNGSGKTTLLDAICGEAAVADGVVRRPAYVRIARAYQQPPWRAGRLRDHLAAWALDETRFRQLLGVLGVSGDTFERDLGTFSQGQLKKVDLARSMLCGADLLLWDEPLNYVDLYSREQIEASVLADRPTLLFIEHDQVFIERVATRIIHLVHA